MATWILYEIGLVGDEGHYRRGAVPAEHTHIRQECGCAKPGTEFDIWPATAHECAAHMRTVRNVRFTDDFDEVEEWLASPGAVKPDPKDADRATESGEC